MAFLQGIVGHAQGQLFDLERDRWVIGRQRGCDIVIDADQVSRQHACIVRVGREYFVEDLQSRNGTFVNRQQVDSRRLLQDHDQLRVGNTALVFRERPAEQQSAAAADGTHEDEFDEGSVVLSQIDSSVENSSARLGVRPEAKLRALFEITRHLAQPGPLAAMLQQILDSLFRVFAPADRGFILLQDDPNSPFLPAATKYREPARAEGSIRFGRGVLRQAIDHRQAILSSQQSGVLAADSHNLISSSLLRSVISAPLCDSHRQPLGAIQLETLSQQRPFQESDLELLTAAAALAAIVIENSRMHEQSLRQQLLEDDLRAAQEVQQAFLPAARPNIAGYEFFDSYQPARAIGGDFYDYIELSDGQVAVIVGDVAGKGITAALLMAKVVAEARHVLAADHDPARAVTRLNRCVEQAGCAGKFATFALLLIDPADHRISIVNAGHMPPLLRSENGTVQDLGAAVSGTPLGVDADWKYKSWTHQLAPGEILTLYTDGISDAMNARGERYGTQRIRQQLQATLDSSTAPGNSGDCFAGQVGTALLHNLWQFVGGSAQMDDICLVCVGRT